MFCFNCGAKIADGSNFCPFCGTKITNSVKDNQVHAGNTNPSIDLLLCLPNVHAAEPHWR